MTARVGPFPTWDLADAWVKANPELVGASPYTIETTPKED